MSEFDLLNLSRDETKVYHVLLVSGQLLAGEIRNACKLTPSEFEQVINNLKIKKLIRDIPGMKGNYAALLPISSLKIEVQKSMQQIDELTTKFIDDKNSLLDALKLAMDQVSAGIKASASDERMNLEKSHTALDNKLIIVKDTASKQAEEKIDGGKAKLSTEIADSSGYKDNQLLEFNNMINQALENMQSQFVNLVDSNKTLIENLGGELSSSLQTADLSNYEKTVEEIKINLAGFKEEIITAADNLHQSHEVAYDSLKTEISSQMDVIKNVGNNYKTDVEKVSEFVNSAMNNFVDFNREKISNLQDNIGTKQAETISALISLNTKNDELNKNLSSKISELFAKSKELKDASKTTISSSITSTEAEINNIITSTDNGLTNQITAVGGEINESIKLELGQIENMIERQLKEAIHSTKQTLEQFTSSLTSKLIASQNEMSSNKENSVKLMRESMQKQMAEMRTNVDQSITGLQEEEKTLIAAMLADVDTSGNNANSEIQKTIEAIQSIKEDVKQLAIALSNHLEVLHSQNSKNIGEFQTNHTVEFDERFTQVITSIDEKLASTLQQLSEATLTTKDTMISAIIEGDERINLTLSDSVSKISDTLNNIYQENSQKFKEALSQASTAQLNLLDKMNESTGNQLGQFKEEFIKINTELNTNFDGLISNLNSKFLSISDELATSLNQYIDTSYNEIKSHGDGIESTGNLILDRAEQLVGDATTNQATEVNKSLNAFTTYFENTSSRIKTPTEALVKILGQLEGELEFVEAPSTKTTHIIGKEAIVEHLNDMLSRIKSKATVLVPSISMVSEEEILKLRSTSQVTIISHIDETTDRDWIDRMHGATANITLRAITGSSGTGRLPDFIGIEREGEEIMLGTIDEGAKDYVAIASASEYFVQTLGNIVISDYSRGKSRQLAK